MNNEELVKKDNLENKKIGKGKIIILGVLSVLIIALSVCYFVLFAKPKNAKEFYNIALNNINKRFNEVLNVELLNKPTEVSGNVGITLSTSNKDLKQLAELINKLKLNINMQTDYNNEKIKSNVGLAYDNNSLVNLSLIVNKNNAYFNLGSLYDKDIKYSNEMFDTIWNNNTNDYNYIIKEVLNILKNNLKEEYFITEKETITINGKDVKTTKYVFALNEKQGIEYRNAIISDIQDNENLLNKLANISNLKFEDIKSELEKVKQDTSDFNSIRVETYLKNKDIVKINFMDEKSTLTLIEIEKDKYNISLNMDGKEIKPGTIKLNDKEFSINLDYESLKVNISNEIKKNNELLKANIEYKDYLVEINLNTKDQNTSGYMRLKASELDIDAKINVNIANKTINKVEAEDSKNYIDYDKLTASDVEKIEQNIMTNKSIMDAFGSLME